MALRRWLTFSNHLGNIALETGLLIFYLEDIPVYNV